MNRELLTFIKMMKRYEIKTELILSFLVHAVSIHFGENGLGLVNI